MSPGSAVRCAGHRAHRREAPARRVGRCRAGSGFRSEHRPRLRLARRRQPLRPLWRVPLFRALRYPRRDRAHAPRRALRASRTAPRARDRTWVSCLDRSAPSGACPRDVPAITRIGASLDDGFHGPARPPMRADSAGDRLDGLLAETAAQLLPEKHMLGRRELPVGGDYRLGAGAGQLQKTGVLG